MIAREPKRYAKLAQGMDGGVENPLGARALYLFKGRKGHTVPHPRHDRARQHRQGRLLRLHPHDESGRHRFVRARAARRQGRRTLETFKVGLRQCAVAAGLDP